MRQIRTIDENKYWFHAQDADLFVFTDGNGEITGLDFCYDKSKREHVLMIRPNQFYSHMRVDDGEETTGAHKQSPIYMSNGAFHLPTILRLLHGHIDTLPKDMQKSISIFLRWNLPDLV